MLGRATNVSYIVGLQMYQISLHALLTLLYYRGLKGVHNGMK